MSIELAIVALTYISILVVSYVIITFAAQTNKNDEMNINRAYHYAYSTLLFGFLIIWFLIELPHITLDTQTTNYLILACKLISVLTLGCSIYVLRRKFFKS